MATTRRAGTRLPNRRSRCAIVCAALLALPLSGCSDAQGKALGTIVSISPDNLILTLSNPSSTTCHRLNPLGATRVANLTLADIVLYRGADCTEPGGKQGYYLPTQTQDQAVASAGLWHSFKVYR